MIRQSEINHFISLIRNHNRIKRQRKESYLNRLQSHDKTITNKFSLVQKTSRHFNSAIHQLEKPNNYQKTPQFSKILQHGKRVKTQVTDLSFNVRPQIRHKNFYDKYKQQLQKKNAIRRAFAKKSSNFFTQSQQELYQFSNYRLGQNMHCFNSKSFCKDNINQKHHFSLKCGLTLYQDSKKSSLLIKKKVNDLSLNDERRKPKARSRISAGGLKVSSQKDLQQYKQENCYQGNLIIKNKVKTNQKQSYSLRRQKSKKQQIVESNIDKVKHLIKQINKDKTANQVQDDRFFSNQKILLQGWQLSNFEDAEITPFSGRILGINI